MSIERIPSGIPGLDPLIGGGFIKGSVTLVTGSTGSGKTIFCSQFIWEGLKRGETCLFITFEELPEEIIEDALVFGWDFRKYIEEKKLFLEYSDPFTLTDVISPLIEKIKQNSISRVAIDSTSLFGLYFQDPADVRKQLYKLVIALKKSGATSLLTAEVPEESHRLSRFGVEEFVVDGVIVLHYMGLGEATYRSLQVRKMRRTDHSHEIHPMKITDQGIIIVK
jgi:KaiC/GvpD/RAD55 family RecA-like ATPase